MHHLDATSTCNMCGKGLCSDCTNRFEMPFCEACLLQHNKAIEKEVYVGFAIMLVIFFGAMYFYWNILFSHQQKFEPFLLLIGLLFSFSYWGWKFLSNYLPRLQQGSLFTWIIYLYLKFTAAYFVGFIVGPYQIYKMVKNLRISRKIKKQIEAGVI